MIIVCTGIRMSRCKILSNWRGGQKKQDKTYYWDTKVSVSLCLLKKGPSYLDINESVSVSIMQQFSVFIFDTQGNIRSQTFF